MKQPSDCLGERKLIAAVFGHAVMESETNDAQRFLKDWRGAAYMSALGFSPIWFRRKLADEGIIKLPKPDKRGRK